MTERVPLPRGRWYGSRLDPLGISHRTLLRAMRFAREHARGALLDIGCGIKPYHDIFQDRVTRYVGIEMPGTLSASAVVDVYASALRLPFASAAFDTVLCNEVLEHVPEPSQLLREAARTLAPGGCLILTAPMTWGLHEEPHDYFRYTPHGLRYLAEQAGLHVEHLAPTTGLWATMGQRLSSMIYYVHGKPAFVVWKGIVVLFCAALQLGAQFLDRLYQQRGDTLDNLLIARKK